MFSLPDFRAGVYSRRFLFRFRGKANIFPAGRGHFQGILGAETRNQKQRGRGVHQGKVIRIREFSTKNS